MKEILGLWVKFLNKVKARTPAYLSVPISSSFFLSIEIWSLS